MSGRSIFEQLHSDPKVQDMLQREKVRMAEVEAKNRELFAVLARDATAVTLRMKNGGWWR